MTYSVDDLSLFGAEDEDHRPTRAQRRQQQERHRRRRRRGGLVTVLVLAAVLGLGLGALVGGRALVHRFGDVPDYPGPGGAAVAVQVHTGDSATDIAAALVKADVVKSEKAFREAAKSNPKSTGIQPGYYRLRRQMTGVGALALLLSPASRLQTKVTVPEGLTEKEVLARTAKATTLSLPTLQAAAASPADLGLPAYARGRLEGFLFPQTYTVEPGTSAADLLRSMVGTYRDTAEGAGLTDAARVDGLSAYQILVVASLVQRETKVPQDGPKIARVIYNRLARDFYLGVDASVLYGLGRTGGALSRSDLDRVTPYNTRKVKGLPPTPIANPGTPAISAALHPAAGPWLYYVLADRAGHHFFTADVGEFDAAAARCRANGLC